MSSNYLLEEAKNKESGAVILENLRAGGECKQKWKWVHRWEWTRVCVRTTGEDDEVVGIGGILGILSR